MLDSVNLRRRVMMVPQAPYIFPGSVLENIQLVFHFNRKAVPAQAEIEKLFDLLGMSKGKISAGLKRVVAVALFVGTTIPRAYFMIIVIAADPWYTPRYFIPIAGVTVGNSMTGVTLGAERLARIFQSSRERIEEALMLGAAPQEAVREFLGDTFSAAIIPTINAMLGMGIIFIPGMMSGQILAGASPVDAIKYQIVIMMCILGSVALAVYLIIQLGYRTFFNDRAQLLGQED